jgi:Mg/Co/Ni transporter MgtE
VVVVVAAITAGSFSFKRVGDVALKSAAVGLVVGGIAAILLWPFFDVS